MACVQADMAKNIPPDVSGPTLTAIGRVVACGGWLELQIAALLASLRPGDDRVATFSQIITRPASSTSRALRESAEFHPVDPEGVRALADAVDALLPRRNDVVHAQWGKAPRGRSVALRFTRDENLDVLVLAHAELQQLALDLHQAAVTAMQLITVEGANSDETLAAPAHPGPANSE